MGPVFFGVNTKMITLVPRKLASHDQWVTAFILGYVKSHVWAYVCPNYDLHEYEVPGTWTWDTATWAKWDLSNGLVISENDPKHPYSDHILTSWLNLSRPNHLFLGRSERLHLWLFFGSRLVWIFHRTLTAVTVRFFFGSRHMSMAQDYWSP